MSVADKQLDRTMRKWLLWQLILSLVLTSETTRFAEVFSMCTGWLFSCVMVLYSLCAYGILLMGSIANLLDSMLYVSVVVVI